MGRQRTTGNVFFRLDVDFFSDKKVKILKARYGADGITLYIYLLCEIYKTGYYLKVDEDFEFIISDDLNMDCNKVKQVLNFLLERSLFDNKLFQSDKVLTSAGIQRRYQAMVKARALKTPIKAEGFWILPEDETEPFIKVNPFLNNSEKKDDNSRKKDDNSKKNETKEKERKVNNIYTAPPETYFEDTSLNDAFLSYLKVMESKGTVFQEKQIQLLIKELTSLSKDPKEQMDMIEKSTMKEWKGFFPLKKFTDTKKPAAVQKNRFNNFPQRKYDWGKMEGDLLLAESDKNN